VDGRTSPDGGAQGFALSQRPERGGEWRLVEPLIPPAKRGGRKRSVNIREVLNGIFYVLSTGCQWKALPKDLPPKSTVYDYLDLWSWDGTLARIQSRALRELPRTSRSRGEPERGDHRQPERQSSAKGGASIDPQGYDAGKKVTGRKRHIMVDTLGLMLGIVVHPANVQDRDGAEALLRQTRRSFPFIEVIFADGGYQGPIMAAVTAKTGKWRLEIVKRNDIPRFEVLPKRWIVERTLAWISHCRRLARDFERHVRTVVAFVYLAMIRLMLRRLTASRSA